MGGKGDDNSSNDSLLAMQQRQEQAQRDAAAQSAAKQAAEPAATPKAEEKPVTEDPVVPVEQPKGDNLTGLGDELVNGLSPGRIQQVSDQQERLKADPQTYGRGFDPYTGTFVGQGDYGKQGQV
jgi:hypothetical protein